MANGTSWVQENLALVKNSRQEENTRVAKALETILSPPSITLEMVKRYIRALGSPLATPTEPSGISLSSSEVDSETEDSGDDASTGSNTHAANGSIDMIRRIVSESDRPILGTKRKQNVLQPSSPPVLAEEAAAGPFPNAHSQQPCNPQVPPPGEIRGQHGSEPLSNPGVGLKTRRAKKKRKKKINGYDWKTFGVEKILSNLANRMVEYDAELKLVVLGTVVDHHTHVRPDNSKIKKWRGIVSDGDIRMTAYFIGDVDEDLSKTLPHGQIISSDHFSPIREEVHGNVQYCEIRFITLSKAGTIPLESLPSNIASIPAFDLGTGKTTATSTTASTTTASTNKPTILNCQGVACTAAIQHAQNNGGDDANASGYDDVPSSVIDTCIATLPPPSLSAMASFNSFYDRDTYPNPEDLPEHHKRQCMYYYYAVHHFEGRGRRVCLPCCVRKKIHNTYPCNDPTCQNNCPTHSLVFEDDFGFPRGFDD